MQVFTGILRFGQLAQLHRSETKIMRFIYLFAISVCSILQANAAFVNDSPLLFDRFSHVHCKEEMARLDNYAGTLKGVPNATAVIIGYGGRNDTRRGEIVARLLSIRDHLIKNSGIDRNRIVILNGGYREELNVELWVILNRENAMLLINPTIQSKDVRFKKGSIKKWEYKCKER